MLIIIDNDSFKEAIRRGHLRKAEAWLNKQRLTVADAVGDSHTTKDVDKWERILFRALKGLLRYKDAKRIVEGSVLPESKQGRIDRLIEESGIPYDEI